VSTNDEQPANATALLAHQWFCAAIDGHSATGWGYPTFGATAKTPFVPVPANKRNQPYKLGELDPSSSPVVNGTSVARTTSLGEIKVDTKDLTGGFDPKRK
jgi:hypothetical protein